MEEWLKELKNIYIVKYPKAIKNKLELYQFIWRGFHKILLSRKQAKEKKSLRSFWLKNNEKSIHILVYVSLLRRREGKRGSKQ